MENEDFALATKEYWLIILLVASSILPLEVKCISEEGEKPYLMWFFGANAKEVRGLYMLGQEILVDYRKIREAVDIFKRWMVYYEMK